MQRSVCLFSLLLAPLSWGQQRVEVNHVELHYVERGRGEPVVFVHGALDDYRVWEKQIDAFAPHFRAIAYSRRYNFPNHNTPVPDHNAFVEADDLAGLLGKLGIQRAHLIGHSYGAYTILALAMKHPELVRSLVLAEPPVHRWAADRDKAVFDQFMNFWTSVGDAFRRNDANAAMRLTTSFFSEGHETYDGMPAEERLEMEKNIAEWKALTTSRDAFPMLDRTMVRNIKAPTLLLCGERTLKIHQIVNDELERLLKGNKRAMRINIPSSTHEMWGEQPEASRKAVFDFLGVK